MLKRCLTPAPLPASKRPHTDAVATTREVQTFDSILYDELVLVIFSYLTWSDLCTVQLTNRHWARLATDNQLWKEMFIQEYGRSRLRGSRGYHPQRKVRNDRQVKRLPSRAKDVDDHIDWKWMFRISSNWRKGRCDIQFINHDSSEEEEALPSCLALVGGLTASTSPSWSSSPTINLRHSDGTIVSLHGTHRRIASTYITHLTLDQSPPNLNNQHESRLVAFYETGDFSVFLVDPTSPDSSQRLLSYHAAAKTDRTSPIIQAAYHHPLLVTLSSAFQLSLYDMSNGEIKHTQTLTSFTSYPPSSLVLSTPSSNKPYRLVISYAVPVYPAHWSVAATELTISVPSSSNISSACTVVGTRTARAIDIPSGWIDEEKVKEIRAQWNRKVGRVADTQTDGKWVVLAPSTSSVTLSPLQLYRLHFSKQQQTSHTGDTSLDAAIHTATNSRNRLTFVRSLFGPSMPVRALALADGRCVSLSAGGEVWVWDLEHDWGVEVQSAYPGVHLAESRLLAKDGEEGQIDETEQGAIVFDERRIVSTDARGVSVRRFDM